MVMALMLTARAQSAPQGSAQAPEVAKLDHPAVGLRGMGFMRPVYVKRSEAGEQACFALACDLSSEGESEGRKRAGWDLPLSHLMPATEPLDPALDTSAMDLPGLKLTGGESSSRSDPYAAFAPVLPVSQKPSAERVQWGPLMWGSLRYLGVMHSFRLLTEAGTREALGNSLFGGYFKALGAMHGWSDGDHFFENYLGHPIQGSVSSFLWIHNDKPRYRNVEFGKSRDYWMSRLRAYAFAWAFSEQFEIGPLSEASIGQIQRYCCQYGFVDHIITPNAGMVWVVGEDILDKYLIRRIEDHTPNAVARVAARTWLNPVQGFANLMNLEWPWYRENRGPLREYAGALYPREPEKEASEFPLVPKFEIAAAVPEVMRFGNLSCLGGGGVAGYRLTDSWQWTLEVSGCTLGNSLPKNWSGDALNWTTGPQWIRHTESRWSPHAHFRVGGQKITEKKVDPQKWNWINGDPSLTDGENNAGQQHWESTGLSMSMGGGLDVRLNAGLAWRFANLDYVHSWVGQLNGVNFDQGFRFTTGVVLRLGTW
jgi:hypothetical protein